MLGPVRLWLHPGPASPCAVQRSGQERPCDVIILRPSRRDPWAVAAAGGDRIDLGRRVRSEKNETRLVIRGYCSRLTVVCLSSEQYNYLVVGRCSRLTGACGIVHICRPGGRRWCQGRKGCAGRVRGKNRYRRVSAVATNCTTVNGVETMSNICELGADPSTHLQIELWR